MPNSSFCTDQQYDLPNIAASTIADISDKKRKSGTKKSNQWDPDAPEGVNYFKQFAKAFMPPYGKAMGVLPNHEILNKLYAYTGEWLTRPAYGISEMADTIYANLSTILKYEDKVFSKGTCHYLASKLEPLKPQLRRFNNKDPEVADPPDLNDLVTFMKTMEADDAFERLVKEYFAASGSMFLVMLHIMVLPALQAACGRLARCLQAACGLLASCLWVAWGLLAGCLRAAYTI